MQDLPQKRNKRFIDSSDIRMSKSTASATAILPEEIQSCLDSFQASLDQVQTALEPFLNKNLADIAADMPPAEKAKLQLLLAYSCNALFYMYLKTQGTNVQQHPVTSELNRVKEYFAKLKSATEKATGAPESSASGPSLRVDKEASKRIVKHSLPRQQGEQALAKKKSGGKDDDDSSSSSSNSSSSSSSDGSSSNNSDIESESDSDEGKGHSKKKKKGKSKSERGKRSDVGRKQSQGKAGKDKGVSKKEKKDKKQKKKKDKRTVA
jgi:exosome complex protein LRP1